MRGFFGTTEEPGKYGEKIEMVLCNTLDDAFSVLAAAFSSGTSSDWDSCVVGHQKVAALLRSFTVIHVYIQQRHIQHFAGDTS